MNEPIIVTQPAYGGVLNNAQPMTCSVVPSGLESLLHLDQIFVKQKVELLEVFLGCEVPNKYMIFDNQGREIFFAKEVSDCLSLMCGKHRPFDMTIEDGRGVEVIHLERPLGISCCCLVCIPQSITVCAPPFNKIGSVEREWTCLIPRFLVKDALSNVVLRIEGPCCTSSCCDDVEFQVLSADSDVEVGKISKKWVGFTQELFTDADNFGISFPMDLDVKMKAVLIGACILIDFLYFETTKQ